MAVRKSNRRNTYNAQRAFEPLVNRAEKFSNISLPRGDNERAMMDYSRFNAFHKTVENGYLDFDG